MTPEPGFHTPSGLRFSARGLLRLFSISAFNWGVSPGAIKTVVCLAIEFTSAMERAAQAGLAIKLSKIAIKDVIVSCLMSYIFFN